MGRGRSTGLWLTALTPTMAGTLWLHLWSMLSVEESCRKKACILILGLKRSPRAAGGKQRERAKNQPVKQKGNWLRSAGLEPQALNFVLLKGLYPGPLWWGRKRMACFLQVPRFVWPSEKKTGDCFGENYSKKCLYLNPQKRCIFSFNMANTTWQQWLKTLRWEASIQAGPI